MWLHLVLSLTWCSSAGFRGGGSNSRLVFVSSTRRPMWWPWLTLSIPVNTAQLPFSHYDGLLMANSSTSGHFQLSIKHTTDRPGLTFDLCANLDIDQHLFVGVAVVLLANSISSFSNTLKQDNNSKPIIIRIRIITIISDVSGKHVYLLVGLAVISFLANVSKTSFRHL